MIESTSLMGKHSFPGSLTVILAVCKWTIPRVTCILQVKKQTTSSHTDRRSNCPINFALELFGDKWTLLIVRDMLLFGKRTYGEFQASPENIATNILADRLQRLENAGLVKSEA